MPNKEVDLEKLPEQLSSETITLIKICVHAGSIALRSRFAGLEISEHRDEQGFVSSGDLAVNDFVHSEVANRFPEAVVLSEETKTDFQRQDASGEIVIVDPIDGTAWYKDGGELWSINLGLMRNSQPVSAAIIQPDLGVVTFAEKGVGAFCQKGNTVTQIMVKPEIDLKRAKIGIGANFASPTSLAKIAELQRELTLLSRGCIAIESSGFELANLARGIEISAYVHPDAKPWDKAAGILIVNEAGGTATDWPGRESPFETGVLAATSSQLHKTLARFVLEGFNQT